MNRVHNFFKTVSFSLSCWSRFPPYFRLEASFWLRFSRKRLFYIGKLHLKTREIWSFGLEVMKNLFTGVEKQGFEEAVGVFVISQDR